MIKYFNCLLAILVGATILSSCGDFEAGAFDSTEMILSESTDHSIRYQTNEKEIKFIVEDLNNTSMNFDPSDLAQDFAILHVDVNNNNEGDANIDKLYSTRSDSDIECVSFYITPTSITGCTDEFGFSLVQSFIATDNNADEHVVYELILRKELLSSNNEVGLIFNLGGDDSGGYFPTLSTKFFDNTLVVSWD